MENVGKAREKLEQDIKCALENEKKIKTLLEDAIKIRLEADDYAKKIKEVSGNINKEAQELKAKAKKKLEDLAQETIKLQDIERDLKTIAKKDKEESDNKLDEAMKINEMLGEFREKLDKREIEVSKKEAECDSKLANLSSAEINNSKQQAILDETLEKIEAIKQGILSERAANQVLLNNISIANAKAETDIVEAQGILDKTLEKNKEISVKEQGVKNKLNDIATDKERNEELLATLRDREKVIALKQRELDDKIKTLNQLRG